MVAAYDHGGNMGSSVHTSHDLGLTLFCAPHVLVICLGLGFSSLVSQLGFLYLVFGLNSEL